MATQMVRKQIYISRRQEQLLKRLSKALGISEANFIRQALDHELSGDATTQREPEVQASSLDEFIKTARQPRGLKGEPMRWNRAELYEERENRWLRQTSEGKDDTSGTD